MRAGISLRLGVVRVTTSPLVVTSAVSTTASAGVIRTSRLATSVCTFTFSAPPTSRSWASVNDDPSLNFAQTVYSGFSTPAGAAACRPGGGRAADEEHDRQDQPGEEDGRDAPAQHRHSASAATAGRFRPGETAIIDPRGKMPAERRARDRTPRRQDRTAKGKEDA